MAKIPLALSEVSLSSSSSSHESNDLIHNKEDINFLTDNVKSFRESLAKLKIIFTQDKDNKIELQKEAAHQYLGEMIKLMRETLEKYPKIQSNELLFAFGNLIKQVKGFNYDCYSTDESRTLIVNSIDQLAITFSTRISVFLMGDLDFTNKMPHSSIEQNLNENNDSQSFEFLSPDQIDERFLVLPEGIDLALHRAKIWSKYAKDVMNYIEKRAQIEAEHSRSLIKHAQTVKSILKEEAFLPFQSIYCSALDQDIENANSTIATCSLLLGHKFIEPLGTKRIEHEKTRKQIKETWSRELKKMHESVNNLKKARALYLAKQNDLEKARTGLKRSESGADLSPEKIEKKRKIEEDATLRAQDAEINYKTCVQEAKERVSNLKKVKRDLLVQIRELIHSSDLVLKTVTNSYFQLQQITSAPLSVQFENLSQSSLAYEPGSSLMEFVKRLPPPSKRGSAKFTFEPQLNLNRLAYQSGIDMESSESDGSSSPGFLTKTKDSSGEELETDHDFNADSGYVPGSASSHHSSCIMSKAAESHSFKKLKTPSRCRECDSYVYFHGAECQECGLAAHKKCLETLTIQCGHVKLPRKMTTFGVPLSSQGQDIPLIVTKCINEIDSRGCDIKGIYRVSGVKSRVEKLCQSFESGHDLVDLSSTPANVIANVLKLYLRQLPEPLMTFRLYQEFIHIAKSHPTSPILNEDETVLILKMKQIVEKLPKIHLKTLSYLIHHLKRVSQFSQENNMPPSNLGIVFGPTLLRASHNASSISSLVDTNYQTRIIELLIIYADEIFDSEYKELKQINNNNNKENIDSLDDFFIENAPVQSKIFKSSTCVTISGQKIVTTSSGSNVSGKQSIVEARRQFFTAPYSPPEIRSNVILPPNFAQSLMSPLQQSLLSSASASNVHPKLRRSSTQQQSQALPNELSRSATHTLSFSPKKTIK